jgi:hypothetical protein
MAMFLIVTFFLKRRIRVFTQGADRKNENFPIYPEMFLFNTKLISHFCLMALDIVVQGKGFLSNVFLIGSARNTWHTGVKIKGK